MSIEASPDSPSSFEFSENKVDTERGIPLGISLATGETVVLDSEKILQKMRYGIVLLQATAPAHDTER